MQENHTIHIRPSGALSSLDLKELWHYRELFGLLVWRDLKVRYKQTLLGVLWALLQPLLTAFIFTIIFTRFASLEDSKVPYWLFALSGFTLWTFTNSSVSIASASLVHHKELVTKIYFPRVLVPLSSVGAYFFDLLLTLLILFAGMIYFGTEVSWKLALVPVFLLFIFVIAASVSLLLATLNVRFRDVKFVIPFALQVWLFLSPVFYPSSWIPEHWRYIFAINPVVGCLEGFRHVLFGTDLDGYVLAISIVSAIAVVILSLTVFSRMEERFADVL